VALDVAQRRLDLGLIEQVAAAPDPERDAGPVQRLLDERGLGIGAAEHGLGRPSRARAMMVAHGAGNGPGLGGVVGMGVDGGERAGRAVRAERRISCVGGRAFALEGATGEHRVGHGEDLGRRPVVLVQADDLARRVAIEEAGEGGGVGTVPRIDGLVRVAYHAQVVAAADPRLEQAALERVDVLELVDEHVLEPPALRLRELLVLEQVTATQTEEIVEVDEAPVPLLVLVALEDRSHLLLWEWCPAVQALGLGEVVVGAQRAGLGPLDLGDDVEHAGSAGRAGRAGEEPGDEADLAVEQVRGADAAIGPSGPELGVGHGVEGAGGHAVAQAEASQP
jgi:hypothetical protein